MNSHRSVAHEAPRLRCILHSVAVTRAPLTGGADPAPGRARPGCPVGVSEPWPVDLAPQHQDGGAPRSSRPSLHGSLSRCPVVSTSRDRSPVVGLQHVEAQRERRGREQRLAPSLRPQDRARPSVDRASMARRSSRRPSAGIAAGSSWCTGGRCRPQEPPRVDEQIAVGRRQEHRGGARQVGRAALHEPPAARRPRSRLDDVRVPVAAGSASSRGTRTVGRAVAFRLRRRIAGTAAAGVGMTSGPRTPARPPTRGWRPRRCR